MALQPTALYTFLLQLTRPCAESRLRLDPATNMPAKPFKIPFCIAEVSGGMLSTIHASAPGFFGQPIFDLPLGAILSAGALSESTRKDADAPCNLNLRASVLRDACRELEH